MFKPLVVLSALVLGSASFAHADSINGSFNIANLPSATSGDIFTVTAPDTITFIGQGAVGPTVKGTFASYLAPGALVTFASGALPYSPSGASLTPPGGMIPLFTVAGGGETFTFELTQYSALLTPPAANPGCTAGNTCLGITGLGFVMATGPANLTPSGVGSFQFTTQYSAGSAVGLDITTYSGSGSVPSAATPEPSSLALLGTGMFGIVGLARRKFNA